MAEDAEPSAGLCRRTILVAEDDAGMRELVVEVLRDNGYCVIELVDGGTLRRRALEPTGEAFDLVVSDVRLPGVTGLSVLESLRRTGNVVPVILMTAFGSDALRQRVEELGAVLFDKPFDLAELRDAVRGMLARSPGAQSELGPPLPSTP